MGCQQTNKNLRSQIASHKSQFSWLALPLDNFPFESCVYSSAWPSAFALLSLVAPTFARATISGWMRTGVSNWRMCRAGLHKLIQNDPREPFDVALVDWNMPNMNGLELVQTVRRNQDFSSLKLMMVTTQNTLARSNVPGSGRRLNHGCARGRARSGAGYPAGLAVWLRFRKKSCLNLLQSRAVWTIAGVKYVLYERNYGFARAGKKRLAAAETQPFPASEADALPDGDGHHAGSGGVHRRALLVQSLTTGPAAPGFVLAIGDHGVKDMTADV